MKLKKNPVYDLLGACIGYQCNKKGIEIIKCEKTQADDIIKKHHYSKKPTKNSFLSLIVYHNGIKIGALQLGYGIRPKIKGNDNPDSVREFDRM